MNLATGTCSISTRSAWLTEIVWVALFLLAATVSVHGQLGQTERFELPVSSDGEDENFTVVSGGVDGLIFYRDRYRGAEHVLEITKMDTALHELWHGVLKIDAGQTPGFSVINGNVLYILCTNRLPGKGDLVILTLDLLTRNYHQFPIRNYLAFRPVDFLISGNAVLIAGYFNYRPFILYYSLQTRQSKILPGFFNEVGEHQQLSVSDSIIEVIVNAKNSERRKSLWIRKYDNEGSLLRTTVLEPDPDKNLIFGRSINLPGDEQIVAGVYGRNGEYSRGVFVARIGAGGEYTIRYYNFGALQNFFRFMREKRQQRVHRRIERRTIRGKKLRFNYRLVVHQLIPYGDQLILLGEAFSPQYKSQSINSMGGFPPTGYNGFTSAMVFDGFQYTHAVVIGFSKTGELLWDNSFEINDVRTFKLEQFVKIEPGPEYIDLLYLMGNSLRSKLIRQNQVLDGKSSEPLKTALKTDYFPDKASGLNKLEYWYPGCLFAYGVQVIANPTLPASVHERRVFFINKILSKRRIDSN